MSNDLLLSYMSDDNFSLESFLEKSQKLFTIYGIFGALSIYLTSFSKDNANFTFLNLGITSSLLLFLIVSVVIIKKAFHDSDKQFLIQYLTIDEKNIYRLVFIIPFSMLSVIIIYFTSIRFEQELSAMGIMFFYLLGMIAYTPFFIKYTDKLKVLFLYSIVILIFLSILIFFVESKVENQSHLSLFGLSFLKGFALVSLICLFLAPILYVYNNIVKRKK